VATENDDHSITLWEVATGKEQGQLGKVVADQPRGDSTRMTLAALGIDGISGGFSGPGGPVGVTFSPDGRALAVRGPDLSVRIWDVTAGKEISQLKGHGGRIETLAFAPSGRALASGATDTTILLWDTAGPLKDLSKLRPAQLTEAEVEAIWSDLSGEDATKARQGVQKLSAAPGQAVPFLSERLKPAARIDPEKITGWIADLDSEKFTVRRDAAVNLLKVGEQAVPALQKALASGPQLETRKRMEELVDRLTGGSLTADQIRLVRAVEALERMRVPEARQLLRKLAEGAPGTLPTREARAALDRLPRGQ